MDAKLEDRGAIAKELRNRTLQGWFPTAIMMTRRGIAPGLKHESNMRGLLEPHFKGSWRYWIFVYPLLALPMAAAEVWFRVVMFIDRVRQVFLAIFRRLFFSQNVVRELR